MISYLKSIWASKAGIGLIAFFLILFKALYDYSFWFWSTNKVSEHLFKNELLLFDSIKQNASGSTLCIAKTTNTLITLFKQLIDIKAYSYNILAATTAYNYACTSCLLLSSILIAIIIVYIGQNGFKNAELKFKFLLMVLFVFSSFSGLSIKVLKHDENISHYMRTYNKSSVLQQEIYNYISTNCTRTLSDSITINNEAFISKLNTEISQIEVANFGLDPDKAREIDKEVELFSF